MLCISFPYFLLKNYKRGCPRLLLFNADEYSIAIIRCFLLFKSQCPVRNAIRIYFMLIAVTYKVTDDHTTKQNSLCLRR